MKISYSRVKALNIASPGNFLGVDQKSSPGEHYSYLYYWVEFGEIGLIKIVKQYRVERPGSVAQKANQGISNQLQTASFVSFPF